MKNVGEGWGERGAGKMNEREGELRDTHTQKREREREGDRQTDRQTDMQT